MITISALEFAMNLERYLDEALKQGVQITFGERILLLEEIEEPLTENGLTEREEEALKARWNKVRQDQKEGRLHRTDSSLEIEAFLDHL